MKTLDLTTNFRRITMRNRYIKRLAQRIICFTFLFIIFSFIFVQLRYSFAGLYTHKRVSKYKLPNDFEESWYRGPLFVVPDFPAERKDWHNYNAIAMDAKRIGPGENGTAAINRDTSTVNLEKVMSLKNGFNAFVSDMISVNRSLPDVRPETCRKKLYLANLPTISVIIPCHNEYISVLKRTLHSIVNRSPKELLHEIIIVDDHSEYGYSVDDMKKYVEQQFPGLVKFIVLPERRGLIYARQTGAKIAKGDVFVFFDSHIECTHNWLPPLLEPIAIDDRISTTPIIDTISHSTFQYEGHATDGGRGGFNWDLAFKDLKLELKPEEDKSIPYKDPVMMGGLFAISRRFYWELGGYDEGLDIWGSEQFELSFKIWMCGGMLLNIRCSRVAHIFRGPWNTGEKSPRKYNFVARNVKRVAEVWMDDYKRFIYEGNPETYLKLDAGDLSERHALRKRLKCKSFQWFLDVVAPDLVVKYPPVEPPDFANGAIQSVALPKLCLDTLNGGNKSPVGVFSCADNLTHPQRNQFWHLTWRHEIENHRKDLCLDLSDPEENASVYLYDCHNSGGNQYWNYNKRLQWIHQGSSTDDCLEIIKNGTKFEVVANECDEYNNHMRWTFGFINYTALPNTK